MRHRKNRCRLNRNSSHRSAMFRNMVSALIFNEIIKTTVAKAKALRSIVEPLITCAKRDTVSNRRLIFSKIHDKKVVSDLFNRLGPRFIHRNGGYTRILKCNTRSSDNAKMAYIELMDRSCVVKKE